MNVAASELNLKTSESSSQSHITCKFKMGKCMYPKRALFLSLFFTHNIRAENKMKKRDG